RRIVVRRRIVPERLSPPATSTGSSILCAYSSEYQPDQAGHLPYVPAAPGTYFARTAYRTAATRHFAFHRCSLSEHPPSRSTLRGRPTTVVWVASNLEGSGVNPS